MKNITFLEEKGLDGRISTKNSQEKKKKYTLLNKPFQKDNFTFDAENENYICLL